VPRTAQEITSEHVAGLSQQDMAGYWWYRVRQGHVDAWLRRLRRPFSYLDFGCGTGGVLANVQATFAPEPALGLDGTQEAIDVARSRGLPVALADFRAPIDPGFRPDAVSCLDVLEHLEDPVQALRNLSACCEKGSTLVVTVPAMPSLHSSWDDVCGHQRRYTRRLLRRHLREGGFEPVRVRYAFSWCVPPAWVQRKLLRRAQKFEFPPVGPLMNRLMTWAGTAERRLGNPVPFGTSLVALARRR